MKIDTQGLPIGVLSDTHDNMPALKNALAYFNQANVKVLLHAGDLISLNTLEVFRDFQLFFVKGNNDPPLVHLKEKAKKLGFFEPEMSLTLNIDEKKVLLMHGDSIPLFRSATAEGNPQQLDYLIKGHTHFVEDYTRSTIRILNPGPLYRAAQYTAALFWPAQDRWSLFEVPAK